MTLEKTRSAAQTRSAEQPLSAPLNLKFDYTRSVGPTIGTFVTGLRDRKVVGARGSDGRVHVPPAEFDPASHEPMTDFVDVSDAGTVVTWSWMAEPIEGQPLNHPFAWALVKLDGADTSMLHAVDAGSPSDSYSVSSLSDTRRSRMECAV